MTLKFYNTLTRQKEAFRPLQVSNVRMYVCGPTVYARPHIGNARSVVVYDVLYRLLRHVYGGSHVTYVRNITDVDDKINAVAIERGISIQTLTKEVTQWFHDDMDALNVLRPTREPKATEHIPQMIGMIEKLIAHGHAYVSQGHVLFAVRTDPKYGRLSGRTHEDQKAGARIEVENYKRDPGDFVLWKPADAQDDPSSVFDSPWGKGRPGWHIECSAMSTHYLGVDFDIHGGGSDLMFPHHENEIAQSCGANHASQFALSWVHNGFLTVNGEKMSKSLGNFITVHDLLAKGIKGEVIRYALLATKYNEPLDWSDKLLSDAQKAMDGFYRVLGATYDALCEHCGTPKESSVDFPSGIVAALSDDLNTPKVMSHLHELVREINRTPHEHEKHMLGAVLKKTGTMLLGLFQQTAEEWFKAGKDDSVERLIQQRIDAKKAKNWTEADKIRKELAEQGIILEDRPDGTTDWRRA